HRDPWHGGALGRGQADGGASTKAPAVPLPAVLRGGGVHGPARALRQARRHDPRLQGGRGGQARRSAGASLLHGRRHRRGAGEGETDAGDEIDRAMRFELATPARLLVSSEVDEVVAPGSEGYFGVLPGHAAFLTTLGSGEVCYRTGRDEKCLAVSGGFAEVTGERVIIL